MMHDWQPTDRLDTILDRLIDRLHEETPEHLVRDYPQSGNTLLPMLQIARSLQRLEHVTMSPAAKQAGRERLRKAVLARQQRRFRPGPARSRQWAGWIAALLIVCTSLISGLTVASANALPNERLYSWKRASERVWLGIQPNPEREIAVSLTLADRRVTETKLLYQRAQQVNHEISNDLRGDYTRTLALIETLPPAKAQPLLEQTHSLGAEHEQELTQLAQQTSGSQQQILLSAVRVSQWVQHIDPKQVTQPTGPGATNSVPTLTPEQSAAPAATSAPPTSTAAPLVATEPPASSPTIPPTAAPTVTPEPTATAAPPKENRPADPKPTKEARPAPPAARPANPRQPAKPTNAPPKAKPKPTNAPPKAKPPAPPKPPKPTPKQDDKPGPPKDPPGKKK